MAISLRSSRPLLFAAGVALCTSTVFAAPTHRAVVSRVSPSYPELARRMHVSGKVMLLVSVDAQGKVLTTKVESGHALLAPAAQDAVSHWRFAPNPETSETEIEINFTESQ
ncbi:MAG: energy transducer TonB [Edaphobacter sp.]